MSNLYRLIPLRILRRTYGVSFDEIVPSDIPRIHGIDRVIHLANSISPGPIEDVKRPWYMHTNQDDNLLVLQGTRYIDIYNPKTKENASFIITPEKVYKNEEKPFKKVIWKSYKDDKSYFEKTNSQGAVIDMDHVAQRWKVSRVLVLVRCS